MDNSLLNYIKYCLGYIKITRERTALVQQKYSVDLSDKYFNLGGLLNGDTDGAVGELINLDTFYSYNPKEVPKVKQQQYDKENDIANKIEEIYNKYRNDQFTKQISFNFGYFKIEIPVTENEEIEQEEDSQTTLFEKEEKKEINNYPLFSLPVKIEKDSKGKYHIYSVDAEVQPNFGIFETIIGEDLYFQLLEEIGKYEVDGKFSLPITDLKSFEEIWGKIKTQLKLKKANFDEKSFSLEEIKIALSPRSNYFLAEDLAKLTKIPEEELVNTALTCWTQNEDLNVEQDAPEEKELFFPFLYDKYQLSSLSLLGNKASIIQGPPGTGKSETISNILCHLAATGKKVLFVSQKAQALKVVKDKLKKLDVKYLYGYLPNPNSAQIGEEDEADGIAPQLSALSSHIEKLGYKFNRRGRLVEDGDISVNTLDGIIEEKDGYRNSINEIIENQRRVYGLNQELIKLKEYDISVSDFSNFEKSFNSSEWKDIKDAKANIELLSKKIKSYEQNGEKDKFEKIFSTLDLTGNSFSEKIKSIRDDIEKTGYDRRLKLLRSFNNLSRKIRLGGVIGELPREITEYINDLTGQDLSRNEQVRQIDSLYDHCYYYESIHVLENTENKLRDKLVACGVSDKEFNVIDHKIDEAKLSELEEVKNKILKVQIIKLELQELTKSNSINEISAALKSTEQERSKRIALYIQNIIDKGIIEKWKQGITVKQVVAKLSKALGKSKKAFKTFDNLRKDVNNFNAILDLIPIWIMELDDASRIVPLEPGIFDYVILDEASQCNVAYTLPVMFRTDRVLFVGDSEQMRDSTIMFKSNRVFDELSKRYQIPEERQIKATGSSVQSVLDIAHQRGFMSKPLRYHYRSPAELIGFSNKYFYTPKGKELIPLNNNYLTYKDTNRVMLVHEVKSDGKEEISDNVNIAEAKAILNLFKELKADEKYREKSIGILSFFNAQATEIRRLFEEEGFNEEEDNYKVSIIEGIQGDEKDIIIYSFVIRTADQKNKYIPLTGESGDIRADINKGRVNVAFSRARLQTHCFISMPVQEIPEKIWLKKYLEYALENGEVAFYSTDLKPFDSYFEEEFYNLSKASLKRGYKIQNQVASCGFKIDFVITNTNTGKRIAIECDGPCHFKDEIDETYGIHIESDEERQHVLEAAGWKFYRIKYADWISESFDRKDIFQNITELLK